MFGQVVVITAFVRNPSHEPLQACALGQVKPLHTVTLQAGYGWEKAVVLTHKIIYMYMYHWNTDMYSVV